MKFQKNFKSDELKAYFDRCHRICKSLGLVYAGALFNEEIYFEYQGKVKSFSHIILEKLEELLCQIR